MSTTAAACDGTPAGLLFKSYKPDAYLYYMWKLTVSFATALCVGVVGLAGAVPQVWTLASLCGAVLFELSRRARVGYVISGYRPFRSAIALLVPVARVASSA